MDPEEQDNHRFTGPERDAGGPERGSGAPPGGLFDGINNYLLLVYAGACLLMHYALSGLLYLKGWISLSLSLPGIFAILIPLFLLSKRSPLGFAREVSFRRPNLAATVVVVVASAAAILPIEAFSSFFERAWTPNADYTSFMLSIKPKGPASFIRIAIGIVLVAGITEELLFRGFIQRILQRNMNGPLAVVLAGILFALSHFNPPAIPGVTALGILFGFIFYQTGNLCYAAIGHAIYNLATLIRLDAASEEEIVSANVVTAGPAWTLGSLATFVLALWLLRRIHRPAGQ